MKKYFYAVQTQMVTAVKMACARMNNFSGLCAFQKDKSQNPGKHGNKFEAFEHVPQPTARGEAVFSTGFDYALQIVKSIIY